MDGPESASTFAELGQRSLVGRMHQQLDEFLAARDQMETLLRVIMEIGADLDLDVTLHRIITAPIERTGAGYGALGVRGPNGTLTSFLHAGMVHMYALAARADLAHFLTQNTDESVQLAVNSPADANRVPTILGPHSHPITAHTAQVRCLLCGSYKSSDGQKGAIEMHTAAARFGLIVGVGSPHSDVAVRFIQTERGAQLVVGSDGRCRLADIA